MIKLWLFIGKNWKLVIGCAAVLALFIYLWVITSKNDRLSSRNEVLILEARQDSSLILSLVRDKIDLQNDTAKYRNEIRNFSVDIERIKVIDKKQGEGLSSKYPSFEELKKRK